MANTIERKRKSERLTQEERMALQTFVSQFPAKLDAAISIGISRNTLDAVLIKGSGKPETVALIRKRLVAA